MRSELCYKLLRLLGLIGLNDLYCTKLNQKETYYPPCNLGRCIASMMIQERDPTINIATIELYDGLHLLEEALKQNVGGDNYSDRKFTLFDMAETSFNLIIVK